MVYMAAVGQPMQQHLEGSLEKVADMTIAPAELKKALGRFAVLDVREREEYDKGHIEGAVHLPLGRLISMLPDDLPHLLELLPRPDVVVYCRQGHRGALAQQELLAVRTPKTIYNLQGGWEGWKSQT